MNFLIYLSSYVSNLIGYLGLLFPLVALAILIVLIRIRVIRRTLYLAITLAPAILLWAVGIIALVLWRPVSWATDFLLRFIPLDRLMTEALRLPATLSRDPLVKGDRRRYVEANWPPAAFPELYGDIPADLRRPLFEDGRLLGGNPVSWLADRHLTESAIRSAARTGFKAGVLLFILTALLPVLSAVASLLLFIPRLFSGGRFVIEQWPGDDPIRTSVWSLFAANLGHQIHIIASKFGALFVYLPAAVAMAIGAAILIALTLLRAWMRDQAAPYELVTKDADVRWPYRIESRLVQRQAYRNQIALAQGWLKSRPTFKVGKATGTLRVRGDLSAPMPGQEVRLDDDSLFQHTLVFGGTGEGKTSAMLRPLMAQILANRKFGAFVVDAKGVLWRDVQKIAVQIGRADDIVVIGTEPGSRGINIMANLSPSQVAAGLRSVLAQVGTGKGDSFWPDMAASIMRHTLTIGRGFALTPKGQESIGKGLHPYSLWWAYQAVLRNELLEEAIAALREMVEDRKAAAKNPENNLETVRAIRSELDALTQSDLADSTAYLESAWVNMAAQTRTGIVANVTSLLDGLGGNPGLRDRFASGLSEDGIDISSALDGKLVLVSLSSIEDGLPARLISILIKTSLYREARRREARWKMESKEPRDHPCLVVMDEVQELATVDPTSGLSDATFWNVARSTGLAGLFATQNLSALTQAMGKEAAANFMQQARSKVFFRSEEQETIAYACWLAGEYERNRVYEDGQRESIEYRMLIDGWDPFAPIDTAAAISGGPVSFFDAAAAILNPERARLQRSGSRAAYSVDDRFIATDGSPASSGSGGGTAGNSARMGSLQAAHWRAEDLERSYRSQGNERTPALTPSDLMQMGRGHAFAHIQRAGSVRQDIITVENAFG